MFISFVLDLQNKIRRIVTRGLQEFYERNLPDPESFAENIFDEIANVNVYLKKKWPKKVRSVVFCIFYNYTLVNLRQRKLLWGFAGNSWTFHGISMRF